MVSASLSKMILHVQRNFLEKTIFWKLLQKWLVSEFGQKTFDRMVKLPLRVQWNSVGKLNLLRKIKGFSSFPHKMWNFSSVSNEVGRVVKLAFNIFKGTFWGETRLNETVFRFSPCFDSEQKTLGTVVTPASSVSTWMFWKKT